MKRREFLKIAGVGGAASAVTAPAVATTWRAPMTSFETTLTLIGGPTVLIQIGGFRLLTDPTFDAPGSYQRAAVTRVKTTGPAVTPEKLGPIDAVLLSHDHHIDNLDLSGRAFLPHAGRVFTTPVGAERLGQTVQGLAPWDSARLDADGRSLHVTATPARHGPPGIEDAMGEVAGFLLGLEAPGDAIYVTGDTVWYEGVAEVAKRFQPRLVILFAGAAKPRGPSFCATMGNNDAIETANAFPHSRIVGIHNEGWTHITESQADLAQGFAMLGLVSRLQLLEPGQPVRLTL